MEAELLAPEAVSLDAAGDLLIADTGNHRIREMPGIAR
jgi:NHL repeat-containing protein